MQVRFEVEKKDSRKNTNKKFYFDLFRIPRFSKFVRNCCPRLKNSFKILVAKSAVDEQDPRKHMNKKS
jgi:hypothetical protein